MKKLLPDTYAFPAIFEDAGNCYIATFPDFPDVYADGESYKEIAAKSIESVRVILYMKELNKKHIPSPTPIAKIGISQKEVVCMLMIDMKLFRSKMKGKLVKKSIPVPEYLVIMAEQKGISLSEVLKDALEEKLKKEEKE